MLVGAMLVWWRLPKRQMRSITLEDPKALADIEDNFRKTIGQALGTVAQVLGGIAVLIGAWLAYHGTQQTLQANQQASHDLLISQQVAKGFEQLGSDKMVLRLGGIYALEGVMNGSDQYHQPVLEALCAFVRDVTKNNHGDDLPPATDIQAALTVIGRHGPGLGEIVLVDVRIPAIQLFNANLSGAYLFNANLNRAYLRHADLSRAQLRGASLSRANLSRVNLSSANLLDADLSGADLSGATVEQSQLDQACGSDTKLPPGLTLKPCPPPKQGASD
jgi:hypothetical protein